MAEDDPLEEKTCIGGDLFVYNFSKYSFLFFQFSHIGWITLLENGRGGGDGWRYNYSVTRFIAGGMMLKDPGRRSRSRSCGPFSARSARARRSGLPTTTNATPPTARPPTTLTTTTTTMAVAAAASAAPPLLGGLQQSCPARPRAAAITAEGEASFLQHRRQPP